MRKWLTLVVFVMLGLSVYLIVDHPQQRDELAIITYRSIYSRIITSSDETLDIPIYITEPKSFFVDAENINKLTLTDANNVMEVSLNNIVDRQEKYVYNEETYYLYLVRIAWQNLETSDLKIDFHDCDLEITYVNGVRCSLPIGDVDLYFAQIDSNPYLSFSNIYTTVDTDNLITGLVVGFENPAKELIKIDSIKTGSDLVNLDLTNAVEVSEKPAQIVEASAVLQQPYENVTENFTTTGSIAFSEATRYFIPFQYLEKSRDINRFPLIISFTCEGKKYEYLIDDFLFFSNDYSLEAHYEDIAKYDYHY